MKASDVKGVIKDAIDNPEDFPAIFLWGGPGIGKSSVVRQAAEEKGVDFIDIRALLLDPTDLRGIPIPEDGKAKWLSPAFLPTKEDSRGVMLFDELLLSPPTVSNAILQLVLDRKLGEYKLPDGWYIVAASNRETEAIGVYKLSPPLANRFVHIDFGGNPFPDADDLQEWVNWAIANDITPEIIAFISKYRPELLYKFDPNRKAFPTPRSYEFSSKIMRNAASEDLRFELIKGCIGEGAAIELRAYMNIWAKLPDLQAILKGEDIIPDSIDVMYATVVGLVSKSNKQEHYNRLLNYALKLQREFSVYLIKLLFAKNKEKVVNAQNWKEVADTLVTDEKILV